MKPIESINGVGRVVTTLLGKTAETLTTKLADKLLDGPQPAKKRRGGRKAAKAKRGQRAVAALVKGGERHV